MKIFITGTTGFIGRSLKEFYEPNHEVIEYFRREGFVGPQLKAAANPDVIINCAGEIYNPSLMFDTNVGFVQAILEWMKLHPETKLIQLGSSSEYGIVPHSTSEVDRINPVDVYQATKGAATLLCQGYARQFNLKTAIARVYSAYGPYERPRRLFPHLYQAFFHNQPMNLYDGVHDFIYIDDFVRGIDLLVNAETPAGEIVNFGSGKQTTNLEVLRTWEKITGKIAPVTYEDRLTKAFESQVWCCDPTYAATLYGFQTKFSLEQGIADFIKKVRE